jgi:integrase
MRPKKTRKPFTLFLKDIQVGPVWYVRFWDESSRKYALTRSTGIPAEGKKLRRYEAEQAAREMLTGIRFTPQVPDQTFTDYVADFWTPDSPYVRECALVKKKPLSADYITMNHENVRRHMEPFPGFQDSTLRNLKPGTILDWMAWAAGEGLSGRVINTVLQGMRVPVRYAVAREDIFRDPFKNIKEAPEERREKGILAPEEVSKLITAPVQDPRTRLAVLLGLLCGLRRGEVRGLQWGDIKDGLLTVCHNFQENEGMKLPKCGSSRIVPIPGAVQRALDEVSRLNGATGGDSDYVMGNLISRGKPLSPKYFQRALIAELEGIGITAGKEATETEPENPNEQKRRNLTFHGLRHTYVTMGRLAGISDMEIQALAGHKGGAMMERYSHASQVLDFSAMREKLEKAVGE